MTKADQPKLPPLPLLLVYGRPTSPELPQASWFRIEDRLAVHAAAHILKFTVIDIASEHDRAVLSGVHEGVLKGNGRMIVGSVSVESYQRIENHVRARADNSGSSAADSGGIEERDASEQNANNTSADATPVAGKASKEAKGGGIASASANAPAIKPIAAAAPDPWDALRIGSHVAAKCWDPSGDPLGWWIGRITGFEKKDYVIVWLDEPTTPPVKVERKHVAILHPSFDIKTEWDRKPTWRS